MKKYSGIFLITLALICAFAVTTTEAAGNGVYGQYGQYGQYGAPGQKQSIIVNKTVATSGTTKGGQQSYVENLSASDAKFAPGDTVTFKLQVKNTSDQAMTDVTITDFLPGSVEFVSGGAFRTDNSIVIDGGDFEPGQEKEYLVKVRVKSQEKLPADRGIICDVNRVRVQAPQASDEDTAQFCIEKQIVGVKTVPQAGPEAGILLMGFQLAGLGTGIYLKKRSK